MSEKTSFVVGYDPGGNGRHGLAVLRMEGDRPVRLETVTLATAEDCIRQIGELPDVRALGVDTLTCWSTGEGGWRPADRWLRRTYPNARESVVTPNGLYGSMGLNGQAVMIESRQLFPDMVVTETHPKVLHWHLSGQRYDYALERDRMEGLLISALGIPVVAETDHAWDAAISAFAAYSGLTGQWKIDLHTLPTDPSERLVHPSGPTHYFWPD